MEDKDGHGLKLFQVFNVMPVKINKTFIFPRIVLPDEMSHILFITITLQDH